jgi:hypothetical protein
VDTVLTIERALMQWLAKDYRQRTLRSAALAAYGEFACRHPEWAAALFDEHFVLTQALPMLVKAAAQHQQVTPGALAEAWAQQMGSAPALHQRRQAAATAMAAYYLELVAEALELGYDGRHWLGQPTLRAVG